MSISEVNQRSAEVCLELLYELVEPELSDPPSGLPLEYMVANFPSRINLNQPLEPLESSRAAASDQM